MAGEMKSKAELAYALADSVDAFLNLKFEELTEDHKVITVMMEALKEWRLNAPVRPRSRRKLL